MRTLDEEIVLEKNKKHSIDIVVDLSLIHICTELAIQYCSFLKDWFEQHGIEVIRTGLQSTEELDSRNSLVAVSYTHLDVYKRQRHALGLYMD